MIIILLSHIYQHNYIMIFNYSSFLSLIEFGAADSSSASESEFTESELSEVEPSRKPSTKFVNPLVPIDEQVVGELL